MKTFLCCFIAAAATCLAAQAQQPVTQATVLTVQERDNSPSTAGSNPADAPLSAEVHSYDITIRVACAVVTGHYDTEFDYMPSALVPNQSVPVRVGKHNLYFRLPGYGPFKVPIVRRKHDRNTACAAGTSSSRARMMTKRDLFDSV